ncbi:MAG: lytic murein transglycosylase B [Cellvibrionaceae bacterium]
MLLNSQTVKKAAKAMKGASAMLLIAAASTGMSGVSMAADSSQGYSAHPQAQAFMDELVSKHDFSREELQQWFAQAEKKQSILNAMSRPAEKTKTWGEYRNIFIQPSRIDKGVEFWIEHKDTLERAEEVYGVPAEIIVAIIGVETRYGSNKGSYKVIDALSTLAFDYPKRSAFFTKELRHYLLLAREQNRDPLALKGSYAGAMGYGQFMPSSYREYAKDFDGDNAVDIWDNPVDAIGSVANYFVRHGWKSDKPVVSRARVSEGYNRTVINDSLRPKRTVAELAEQGITPIEGIEGTAKATAMKLKGEQGAEFWVGLQNFYTITRYNHSRLYAMAVYQLSQEVRREMDATKTAG